MKKNLFSICAVALLGAVAVTSCKDSDDLTNERLKLDQEIYDRAEADKALQGQITTLENNLAALKSDYEKFKGETTDALKEHASKIKILESAIEAAKERLDAAEKRLGDAEEDIANLQEDVTNLENDFAELKSEIAKALKGLVTGISVNQVYSYAYGNFTGIFGNEGSNLLVGYYGTDAKTGATFPKVINLGTVNFSVNPAEVEFAEGQVINVINSKGENSNIKLTAPKKAENAVQAGITRAEAEKVYSWESEASIALGDIETIKIDLAKSNLLSDVKTALKTTTRPTLSTFANLVYKTVNTVRVDVLGLETTFAYDFLGEQITNTQTTGFSNATNFKAVAVKPLGFNAVEAFGKPMYDAGKKAMAALVKEVGPKALAVAKELYPSLKPTIKSIIIKGVDVTNKVVNVECLNGTPHPHQFTVQLPENFSETELVNKFIAKTKEVVKSDKFQNAVDKIAEKVGAGIEKMILPQLFVYSETGFCRAGVPGDPTFVKGDKVLFYPSSYSAELLVPIAKKHLYHDGQDLMEKATSNNPLAPIELSLADFDPNEGDGYHTVEFEAIDYTGKSIKETYAIYFCK